ncbi:hypothetical protein BY458DRAFT_449696 [Sporodiniella umbellata]|nr:hypothetical protein BY458DRAFT_449696 [Sporodiniella umbellata]
MDDYLSSIDKYLREKELAMHHPSDGMEQLLGEAENGLPLSDASLLDPFYNENDMSLFSSTTKAPEAQNITFLPFIHSSDTHAHRKKPGRKPKGTSPAVRKAQNRAAQRAFRERKERHVSELETLVHDLKLQRQKTQHTLRQLKSQIQADQTEKWYMRGCILTLQYLLLLHQVKIPLHTPYLEKEYVASIQGITPTAEAAYYQAKTQNDNALVGLPEEEEEEPVEEEESESVPELPTKIWLQGPEKALAKEEQERPALASNREAIDTIRELLGPFRSGESESALRMKPTLLQQRVPHDPRINIIPLPYMRDRMILFRNLIDFDRIFSMLMNEAVFYGGDPTLSKNWELPPHIFEEFWFLRIKLDSQRAAQWRKARGLPEIQPNDWNILTAPADTCQSPSILDFSTYSPESLLYENFSRSPQSRKPIYPPTLENIAKGLIG